MESFVGGVGQLVAQGVARCQERVQQQERVCLQDRETLLQLLVRTCTAANTPQTVCFNPEGCFLFVVGLFNHKHI